MKETSISSTAGAQPANLISANAPRRSFIAHFQRWEWMLVAAGCDCNCDQQSVNSLFFECPKSVPYVSGLHGAWPDDAADGVHHHHR